MNMELAGQVALVTGGSGGIGSETALQLAAAGAIVAVHYLHNQEGAEAAVKCIRDAGGRAAAFQADLTDLEQIDTLANQVQSEFGHSVDILVNNAGYMKERALVTDLTEAYYSQMMDVNFKSAVFLSKAVLPDMLKQGRGSIINIASLAGHNGGGAGVAIYAAAKGAMLTFTKSLAKEVAGTGIRVNAIAPGVIADTSNDRFKNEEIRKSIIAGIPLKREGLPKDVAGSVLFLASNLSSFMTGETLEVNGGMLMR